MTNFKVLIKTSTVKQLAIEQLQQALERDLCQQPDMVESYRQLIVKFGEKGILDTKVVEVLLQQVFEFSQSNPMAKQSQKVEYKSVFYPLVFKVRSQSVDFEALTQALIDDLKAEPEKRQYYTDLINRFADSSDISIELMQQLQTVIEQYYASIYSPNSQQLQIPLGDNDLPTKSLEPLPEVEPTDIPTGDLPQSLSPLEQPPQQELLPQESSQKVSSQQQQQEIQANQNETLKEPLKNTDLPTDLAKAVPTDLPKFSANQVEQPVTAQQKQSAISRLITKIKQWVNISAGIVIIALAISALVFFSGNKAHDDKGVNAFIALLATEQHQLIESQIANIFENNNQQQLFGLAGANIEIRGYLIRRITALVDKQQFATAERLANWYSQIFQDDIYSNLVADKKWQVIGEIDQQLNSLINNTTKFAQDYVQLEPLWQQLNKIDSLHVKLSDRLVAAKLNELYEQLIEQKRYNEASDVANFAVKLFSNNAIFSQDIHVFEQNQLVRNSLKIKQSVLKLTALNAQSLADYQIVLDDMILIKQLEPKHPVLVNAIEDLQQALNGDLSRLISNRQWQRANDIIETYGKPLGKPQQLFMQQDLLQLHLNVMQYNEKLFRQIVTNSRNKEQQQALAAWQQLQSSGASEQTLQQAKQVIDDYGSIKPIDDQALVEQLAIDISNAVEVSPMTIEQAAKALLLIEQMKDTALQHEVITSAKFILLASLQQQVNQRRGSTSVEVLTFAYQVYRLFPQNADIKLLVDNLYASASQSVKQQKNQYLANIEAQIEDWLKADDLVKDIYLLKSSMQDYAMYLPDKAKPKYRLIAEHLAADAELKNRLGQPELALSLIEHAQFFAPQLSQIQSLKQTIVKAKQLAREDRQANQLQLQVSSILDSFNIQLMAKDIEAAERLLIQLQRLSLASNAVNTAKKQLISVLNNEFAKAIGSKDIVLAERWYDKIREHQGDTEQFEQISQLQADLQRQQQHSANANVRGYSSKSDKACDQSLLSNHFNQPQSCYDLIDEKHQGPNMVVTPKLNGEVFAISRYEITVGDYNLYCQMTGFCDEYTNGITSLPITNLPVTQMQAYSEWLSSMTGEQYRLPNIQEWTHAAISQNRKQTYLNCKSSNFNKQVRGFELLPANYNSVLAQNDIGLTHYLGNAAEVVVNRNRLWRVGGSYNDDVLDCALDAREIYDGSGDKYTGFRLVRAMGG